MGVRARGSDGSSTGSARAGAQQRAVNDRIRRSGGLTSFDSVLHRYLITGIAMSTLW